MCDYNGKIFHRNIAQHNVGTGSMRWVIFDYYVNKFGTYLFISESFCALYFRYKKEMRLLCHIVLRGNMNFW